MKTFNDLFRFDDGPFSTLPNWNILTGPGFAQDNAIGLSAASDQVVGLTTLEMDSLEHLARCNFELKVASDDARVGLLVRAEFTNASPDFIRRTYLVTISGTGVIRVFSILMGDPAPAPFATATIALDITRAHTFIVKVRDAQRGQNLEAGAGGVAQLLVFVDDEVSPALMTFDEKVERPEGKRIGFDVTDTTGAFSAFIGEFQGYVLKSSVIRQPIPVPFLKNFGDLKSEVAFRMDRAGNSQFNDNALGQFVNYAQNEVFNFEGYWRWAEKILCFAVVRNIRMYELPPYVKIPGGVTDRTNARLLNKGSFRDMRRIDPDDSLRGNLALRYSQIGIGDWGGPVIAIEPMPSAGATMEMPYYAKPLPMVEDTDIPIIPPEWLEVVIYGALKRAAQYSDASRLWQSATQDFERMLAKMRRDNYRDSDKLTRLRTELNLNRIKTNGIATVARGLPLGFG